jgi:hypothetical protein
MVETNEQMTPPWQDPVVAEVRTIREELFREVGQDLRTLAELFRRTAAPNERATATSSSGDVQSSEG